MQYVKYLLATLATTVVGLGVYLLPAHALTVSSQDCSAIDTTDGNVEDWENIPYLINTTDEVEGTTYYLDSDTEDWTTTEPSNWRYSANLDQQANIQEMKMCNTDIMQLMLRTEEPMMNFYDSENDNYTSFYSSYGEWPDMVNFTLPADYHYWMVWKMQAADGSGSIIYMAANLEMDAGTELSGNDQSDPANQVPKLYLYQESDTAAAFDDALFDANVDEQLVQIELSEGSSDCNQETGEGCESPTVEKNNTAFEVSQNISELFEYADFVYGDTINISAAMYNSDEFSIAANDSSILDETDTKKYTFSKRAITDFHPVKQSSKATSISLTWDKLKNADGYQIKLINPNNDKMLELIRGISGTEYKVTGLDADTTYRAIVRAVIRKNGKKTYSAWSSGYKWTTDSE
ncbi:MAG: fibronectin type III domain-containing protein [Candidatus Kerfeldbacteria bacterium]|nr:fibronectin type III domain-containing protein [Candidatus Kerfeldbacteria bacterium]